MVRANGGSAANSETFLNPALRAQLLNEAKAHVYIASIEAQLDKLFLGGKGDKTGWRHIRETMPRFKVVNIYEGLRIMHPRAGEIGHWGSARPRSGRKRTRVTLRGTVVISVF